MNRVHVILGLLAFGLTIVVGLVLAIWVERDDR